MNLYPLKFTPILQPKIWGGEKLHTVLNKPAQNQALGESWEVSDVKGFHSVISNGVAQGKTLNDLLQSDPIKILGKQVYAQYNGDFPLLIKYLDANTALSVQVHPNDEWANQLENGYGKTEMWYIMHAEKDAAIYLGWKENTTPEEIEKAIAEDRIMEYIETFTPKKGDVFFVPAQTVHAIGKGVVLAEIQQTSNTTYRLYDWGRLENGKPRDLHLKKGLQVMNFDRVEGLKKDIIYKDNEMIEIVKEQYFTTRYLSLKGKMELQTQGCFYIFMGISGQVDFDVNGEITTLYSGETLLIPAAMDDYSIQAKEAELLCVSV